MHRPSGACAGDASPSMHRSRGCALVTARERLARNRAAESARRFHLSRGLRLFDPNSDLMQLIVKPAGLCKKKNLSSKIITLRQSATNCPFLLKFLIYLVIKEASLYINENTAIKSDKNRMVNSAPCSFEMVAEELFDRKLPMPIHRYFLL